MKRPIIHFLLGYFENNFPVIVDIDIKNISITKYSINGSVNFIYKLSIDLIYKKTAQTYLKGRFS
jgi:hypothetical protein